MQAYRFQRSYVDTEQDATAIDTNRTSTFVSFAKQQDSKIAAIEQRAASLLGCYTTDIVEPLQLVRYRPGQFFNIHHDMADYKDDDDETSDTTSSLVLPPKNPLYKRRLVTIFCYLNHVEQGGETYFPAMDLLVQPVPGRAVVFCNINEHYQPDVRTVHAGRPVIRGVKYGLNIWLTEE